MECIFCKISEKEIPSRIIFETENSLAFLDTFPLTFGHTLVIPKQHYKKIQDLPSDINSDLFSTVHKVIEKIDAITGSTLIAIHNGKEAGQEIPHLHVHLVPRNSSDSGGPIHSMFDSSIKLSDSEIERYFNLLKI